jgi:hypothetical protein
MSRERRRRSVVVGVLFLFSIAMPVGIAAAETVAWKSATSKDGRMAVRYRIGEAEAAPGAGRALIEYEGSLVERLTVTQCVKILKDGSRHKEFNDDKVSKTLRQTAPGEWLVYYYSPGPLGLPDGDCVVRMVQSPDTAGTGAVFTLTAAPTEYAPTKARRMQHYAVTYRFFPVGADSTRISIAASIVPAFDVPRWMINAAFPATVYELLGKLAALAKKG